jgi:hypothetical protein
MARPARREMVFTRMDVLIPTVFIVVNTCCTLVVYLMFAPKAPSVQVLYLMQNILFYGVMQSFTGFLTAYVTLRTMSESENQPPPLYTVVETGPIK